MKFTFLASLLILLLTGCKQPREEGFAAKDNGAYFTVYTEVPDGQLVSHYYKTNSPKEIYLLNHRQLKTGFAYHYHKNGKLKKKSQWKNGKKEGEELTYDFNGHLVGRKHYIAGVQDGNIFLFKNGSLKTHQIKKSGELVYEGLYEGPKKQVNKIYPIYVEEFFFEDKYYAKIKFPIDYPGKMEIQAKGIAEFHIEPLKYADRTFQLVFNHALDLTAYELKLSYHPAPSDTLVSFTYFYEHVIYAD